MTAGPQEGRKAPAFTIETSAEPGGHSVRVLLRDNGPGIPELVRERLFEPFGVTTKKAGSGLGLYLCKRHVELFGGTIRVDKSGPEGTDFLILLPTVLEVRGHPPSLELLSS